MLTPVTTSMYQNICFLPQQILPHNLFHFEIAAAAVKKIEPKLKKKWDVCDEKIVYLKKHQARVTHSFEL